MVLTEVGLLHLLVPGLQREVYHLHTNFRYANYISYFAGKLICTAKKLAQGDNWGSQGWTSCPLSIQGSFPFPEIGMQNVMYLNVWGCRCH